MNVQLDHWDEMEPVVSRLHGISHKPVLLADFAYGAPSRILEIDDRFFFAKDDAESGRMYRQNMTAALGQPYMVGCHLCVYVENHIRLRGLKDHLDQPYEGYVAEAWAFHDSVYEIADSE
jgi:hypothetical protein